MTRATNILDMPHATAKLHGREKLFAEPDTKARATFNILVVELDTTSPCEGEDAGSSPAEGTISLIGYTLIPEIGEEVRHTSA